MELICLEGVEFAYGDTAAAFATADARVALTVDFPRLSFTPMECYVVVAEYRPHDKSYDVMANFQGPFSTHPVMAKALRVPGTKMRLRIPPGYDGLEPPVRRLAGEPARVGLIRSAMNCGGSRHGPGTRRNGPASRRCIGHSWSRRRSTRWMAPGWGPACVWSAWSVSAAIGGSWSPGGCWRGGGTVPRARPWPGWPPSRNWLRCSSWGS